MTRVFLSVSFLLSGCGVEELAAILAKYDTFGESSSSGELDTGAAGSSTGGGEPGESGTDSTGGPAPASTTSTNSGTGGLDTGGETTAGPGSTGPAGPVCGDGVVEGEEECDDANTIDGDGCYNNCTRSWLVFVTSEPRTQGGLKGLIGADYQCRHRASKLFLPNGDRYMAWVSTSEVQPADRMYHARGPYRLVNGDQVAANWDALVAGPLDHPIMLDELGEVVNALVFTGTTPEGWRVPNSTRCDDWTDSSGKNFTWYGDSTATDKAWTFAAESHCGAHAALYCFEQP
jgi:cysteine-rich repeat protein